MSFWRGLHILRSEAHAADSRCSRRNLDVSASTTSSLRAVACGSRLHSSGSSPGCVDPDLLELFGDGDDRECALRRSSQFQPAANALLPPADVICRARPCMHICVCLLVAQAAFDRCRSRVRHFGGVFAIPVIPSVTECASSSTLRSSRDFPRVQTTVLHEFASQKGQNFLRGALPRTPPGLTHWTHIFTVPHLSAALFRSLTQGSPVSDGWWGAGLGLASHCVGVGPLGRIAVLVTTRVGACTPLVDPGGRSRGAHHFALRGLCAQRCKVVR